MITHIFSITHIVYLRVVLLEMITLIVPEQGEKVRRQLGEFPGFVAPPDGEPIPSYQTTNNQPQQLINTPKDYTDTWVLSQDPIKQGEHAIVSSRLLEFCFLQPTI